MGLTGPTGAAGPAGATGPTGPAGSANINGTTNFLVKFTSATAGGNSSVFDNGNVGIGTTSPGFKLDVTGDIRATNNVYWGGGAYLRNDQGGSVELGPVTANGSVPYIDFHGASGVGAQDFNVRVINSADQRLSVQHSNGNALNFTSSWQGTPDSVTNTSEISNDTGNYKTLMIIGNRSSGVERRVSVWDRLTVNGTLCVNGDCSNTLWPSGSYCILRKGGSCPAGFAGGTRFWDDEDIGNTNSASGSLPDGSYNSNTTIQFCCK